MSRTFYVYAYYRLDGTPCYIGKGTGDRWVNRGKTGRNPHFLRIVAQAHNAGNKLPKEKIAEGLTEQEALDLEAFFIAAIGREVDGGPLVNLSVGGDSGPVGYKWTEEQRRAHGAKRPKTLSAEWRAAISAGIKGKPKSIQHVAAQADSQRGTKKKSGWWATKEGREKHNAKTGASIKTAWVARDARSKVVVSGAWANQNSVRFPTAA
jgi:hypothetical protein